MIRVFIDGPIAGDVRTDFPASLGPTVRVPIPRRVTTCYCDDDYPASFESPPEVVDYHAIAHGSRVAIMSTATTDDAIVRALRNWTVTDLGLEVWMRDCRDRRAFT